MSFIFGGDTGTTYEALQRKRAMADALMQGRKSTPRTVDGIASAAESIAGALIGNKADRQKGELDADWLKGAQGSGLSSQHLAILKDMPHQARMAYMLNQLDKKPTGGPSKSDLQNTAAMEAIAAALQPAEAPSAGPTPADIAPTGPTTAAMESWSPTQPEAPLMQPVEAPEWRDPNWQAQQAAGSPRQFEPIPPAFEPHAFSAPTPPEAAPEAPAGGVTPELIKTLRMQGITTGNKQLLSMVSEMEKMLPKGGFNMLSPEEVAQMGLPADKSWQVGPDNKISQVGGGGVTVNTGDQGREFGTIPQGYVLIDDDSTPSGKRMVAVTDGPEDTTKNDETKEETVQQSATIVADEIAISKELIKGESFLNPTTGITGNLLSKVDSTDAGRLKNRLTTIKANIGFDKLQAMRDASPTGGALGQVSEFENRLLQAVFGSLEQSQDAASLNYNLSRLENIYDRVINKGIPDDEARLEYRRIMLGQGESEGGNLTPSERKYLGID